MPDLLGDLVLGKSPLNFAPAGSGPAVAATTSGRTGPIIFSGDPDAQSGTVPRNVAGRHHRPAHRPRRALPSAAGRQVAVLRLRPPVRDLPGEAGNLQGPRQ